MAENETTGVADETETEEQEFEYAVQVEETGPGTKKVSVEIPRERIDEKLKESFKELRQQAAIPGFRPGRAPQKLIEKRFETDVKDQVRRKLIGESYEQAVQKNNLQVIGEPQFDNPDAIQLPVEGNLSYTFEVEVQPEFDLPDLTHLTVKRPTIEVKDQNVDQAMQNLLQQQGALVPVEDRGVEDGDYLLADVHMNVDGSELAHQHDAQIVARAGRIGGVMVEDLGERLRGLRPGETRTIQTKAPDTHATEQLRGKDVDIHVTLKDIKRLELAQINEEFLLDLGFESEAELRDALRQQMVEKIDYDVQQAMREQVNKYLLDNTQLQVPNRLSDRQTDRVTSRRAMDLLTRGMPREQVEANIERLRNGAQEEGLRELKLFFILQKIANDQEVDVDEGELNSRVAMMAIQRGERPEKLKQEMSKDGSLANLYVQMREQKAVDKILSQAQIENVAVQPADPNASTAPAATPEASPALESSPSDAQKGEGEQSAST